MSYYSSEGYESSYESSYESVDQQQYYASESVESSETYGEGEEGTEEEGTEEEGTEEEGTEEEGTEEEGTEEEGTEEEGTEEEGTEEEGTEEAEAAEGLGKLEGTEEAEAAEGEQEITEKIDEAAEEAKEAMGEMEKAEGTESNDKVLNDLRKWKETTDEMKWQWKVSDLQRTENRQRESESFSDIHSLRDFYYTERWVTRNLSNKLRKFYEERKAKRRRRKYDGIHSKAKNDWLQDTMESINRKIKPSLKIA